jgi:hypothetical protein
MFIRQDNKKYGLNPSDEAATINEKAYEDVKEVWVSDKIWDPKWGKYPGMRWIHEFPSSGQDPSPFSERDWSLPTG